jgi:hypothetical protein
VRLALFAATLVSAIAEARGVSPYLPLGISPEIERKIERVLILAEQPALKRPLAAATVLDALPRACERDAVLCEEVQSYLRSLTRSTGISYTSVAAGGGSGPDTAMPNRHGMSTRSGYEAAASAYWQPSDHLFVAVGALAYEGEATPTGTVVSLGREYLQVDVGFRDRAWSPFQDSAMLLGTQSATMPSVTVSNFAPFTRWNLRYEAFLGRMSESDTIGFEARNTSGNPRLFGLHLSVEPLPGWSLGVSRLMQYGGGERNDSLSDLVDAFFNPSDRDNLGSTAEFGNQVAALSSQFVIGEPLPMTVYFEYAGEDTSTLSNFRLGNTSLSAGVSFPKLGERLSATFELAEWQNAWYVHHIYRDGLRNEGHVIGHWGADWRVLDESIGARSMTARIGIDRTFGGLLEATYRQLDNDVYGSVDYRTARQLDARYSRRWQQWYVGGEVTLGRDVFGESYSRVAAFIRF